MDRGGWSRDEEPTDERESRTVRKSEESDVGVNGFFPGCAKHFDGGDRSKFTELGGGGTKNQRRVEMAERKGGTNLLVSFVGVDGVVAGK